MCHTHMHIHLQGIFICELGYFNYAPLKQAKCKLPQTYWFSGKWIKHWTIHLFWPIRESKAKSETRRAKENERERVNTSKVKSFIIEIPTLHLCSINWKTIIIIMKEKKHTIQINKNYKKKIVRVTLHDTSIQFAHVFIASSWFQLVSICHFCPSNNLHNINCNCGLSLFVMRLTGPVSWYAAVLAWYSIINNRF